jgi:uncharacterized SAM-binding protein YcdF (DUF218 family)
VPFPFDAVLVLGKALGREPERCHRELRARAAAAAAAHRAGAERVLSLEAQLRGQDRAGSAIVAEHLATLGVRPDRLLLEERSRSTRDEALLAREIVQRRVIRCLLVISSAYHVPRARRIFTEVLGEGRASVHGSMALYALANPQERRWILAGEPSEATMAREGRLEGALLAAESFVGLLPRHLRWGLERWAAALWRA